MIFTDRKITIRNGKSSINEPVILYRGDFEVSIRFTIMESKFRFKSGVNLVDSEKASFGQLAILAPYGGNVFSEIVKCEDGTVTFTLTKEMIDQLEEVGLYSFQIRLFDYYRESRVSIPPVEFGIEVREPVASEDHDNEVNNAIVGYSIAKVVDGLNEDVGDTFDANGQYNKTNWETGDRISQGKLNKIEDAIDKINQNEKKDVADLDKRVTNNFNILESNKADKNEIFSMANMGQDVKEAMTGGSVAVVGKDAILTENIVDGQVTYAKLSDDALNDLQVDNLAASIDWAINDSFNVMYGCGKHYTFDNLNRSIPYYATHTANLATIGDKGQIIIEPGGYYFYDIYAEDLLAPGNKATLFMEFEQYTSGFRYEYSFKNSNSSNYNINLVPIENHKALTTITVDSDAARISIRLDNRKASTTAIVNRYIVCPGKTLKIKDIHVEQVEQKLDEILTANRWPDASCDDLSWVNYGSAHVVNRIVSLSKHNNQPCYKFSHVIENKEVLAFGYEFEVDPNVTNSIVLSFDILHFDSPIVQYCRILMFDAANKELGRYNYGINGTDLPTTIRKTMSLNSECVKVRIRWDLEGDDIGILHEYCFNNIVLEYDDGKELRVISNYEFDKAIKELRDTGGKQLVKYVSTTGSDENTGNTKKSAYATVNKAIAEGAETIIMERGVYYNQGSITVNGKLKNFKLIADDYEVYNNDTDPMKDAPKVTIIGADKLSLSLDTSSGLYKANVDANNTFLKRVFVDKTYPPLSDGTRPSYNACVWENSLNDVKNDLKLKPVLTMTECKGEKTTFYYDGAGTLYLNPTNDISQNEYYLVKNGHIIDLRNTDNVEMSGIECNMCMNNPVLMGNVKSFNLYDCEANRSVLLDGFSCDYSDGIFTNCIAYKNRNDGFNFHHQGNTTLINCQGFYNYDDGCSHHENCIGTVIGGNYYGNHKGGIIPVNGSTMYIYGANCYENNRGIYLGNSSSYARRKYVVRDCNCHNNAQQGLYVGNCDADIYNVTCENNGWTGMTIDNSNVFIENARMIANYDMGIECNNSNLIIKNSSIANNNNEGVNADGSEIEMSRCHLIYNGVALRLSSGSTFNIPHICNAFGNTTNFIGVSEEAQNKFKSFGAL